MKWEDKNVLVTGASGMLGGHVVSDLLKKGANVVAIVRDDVPHTLLSRGGLDKKISVVRGSVEDYFLVERAMNEYEVESVFHLGAQTIVGTANRSPLSTFESNMRGTWNVLESARNSRLVKCVVAASTDKVYGEAASLPYKETHPLLAKHPYDVSKACADMLCSSYHSTYGLMVGVTRCGNIFGAGDLNFNRIVPGTIRSLLRRERPVVRSDGKMVRDYVYAEDVSEANLLLAEKLLEGKQGGEAFNFSYGSPLTVLQVVSKISKAMGSKLEPVVQNRAHHEIQKQYLSSDKAREHLGWKPAYNFERGLALTIDWYKKYLG